MTPGLRTHKQASLRVAFAEGFPEDMQERMREILSLNSGEPGNKQAKGLMWKVCREADRFGIVLILRPLPFADGLDVDALERFYGKFGFDVIQTDPVVLMARTPEGPR